MNSQVVDDFHAALLAMQHDDVIDLAETEREQATARLVDEVFGFLDAYADFDGQDIDRLAA
ncbi:MAG: hypothetical protein AAGB04_24675 [Pseudomonadota bacterium]